MISLISKILKKKDFLNLQILVALNFISFFLELISIISIPIFVGLIIDADVIINKFENFGNLNFSQISNEYLIKYFGLFIISIFVIKNIFYYSLTYIQGNFVKSIKLKLSKDLLNFYVMSPFSYHIQNNPATLTRNTTDSIEGISVVILQGLELFKETLAVLVVFIILAFVNPIITISIATIFSILAFLYLKKIRPSYKKKAELNESFKVNFIQTINETFGAIKDIKILNKEKDIVEYYEKYRNEFEQNLFYFTILQKVPKLLLETIAILVITLSTVIILSLNNDILTLFSILSLIVVAIARFIPAFNSIITSLFYIRLFQPSVRIILNELNKIEKFKKDSLRELKYEKPKNKKAKNNIISLENISFSYNDSKKEILKNINLSIEKGTIVGITGETGSGKSTLFHIMLGLLKPKTGNVFNLEQNIHDDLANWRNQIGYIAQNIYLLDNTIEQNISFDFLNQKIDKKRMDFSIKMSCLDQKISELPFGLKTKVGNDGVRLSGGEKQRIALARSIYKNPKVFFMDESTSALDSVTEQKIIKNLKDNFTDKTIVLIAHRKTTVEACDKIINLKNGNIN